MTSTRPTLTQVTAERRAYLAGPVTFAELAAAHAAWVAHLAKARS